ncbi:MAG: 3-deoxy-manno-octulosonate cytidylyltransferase [Alphaproteobacteria bacterium]|nr:3-deoxy-manno-octulosonate cytidylyltransferase [Alphaproteobacteria bacterium]
MKTAIFIPARMASSRLPNKPMADIGGLPMIVQVWKRAVESGLEEVIVACDHAQIADAIHQYGGKAVLTDPNLPSGSDRIWAALQQIKDSQSYDYIINLQGDIPTINPALIPQVLEPLQNLDVEIATLATLIDNLEEVQNPNVVKIALALLPHKDVGRALYFSRAQIPAGAGPFYHHIGLYAYRRPALERFIKLAPSALEQSESLEQLRALEAGMRIDVKLVESCPLGVDTPADLENARLVLS